MFDTIVTPATVAAHLDDPHWRIVDCRFSLADRDAGMAAWRAGHVPGAVYAHLDDDLAAPVTRETGRHPLPDVATFAATLGRWGIGSDTQVIAYDDAGGAIAARLWWMLGWVGHDAVAVMDGGFARWQAENRPVTPGASMPPRVAFRPRLRRNMVIGAQTLSRQLKTHDCLLLDARDADRFLGEVEPLDVRAGHVPGAINYPFRANLDADGQFLEADLLRRCFDAVLAGQPPDKVVSMCGSGVTACHNLLAMAVAGHRGGRLYAGSFSHWITDPARPIAVGPG